MLILQGLPHARIFMHNVTDDARSGSAIRSARRSRGWSQAELASKLEVSQSLISRAERGLQGLSPAQEQRLAKLLGPSITRRKPSTPVAFVPLEPKLPRSTGRVPLKIVEWQHRRPSGDFSIVIPARDSALIVLGDVAGNGPRVAGLAHYVKGWLRGAMGAQERGASALIAEELDAELRATEIEAAYFLAIVRREDARSHRVTIEYVRRGMAAPLLLHGYPTASRALADERELMPIVAPWRLVAASDGLLQRLGGGNELDGMRHIARWQASEQRDQPAGARFRSDVDGSTDESLWTMEWNGWDRFIEIEAHVYQDRHFLHRWIRSDAGEDAGTAVAELVGNSLRHGYRGREGTIWGRLRHEELATCIEIEDHGVGGLTQATIDSSRNGLAIVRGIASHVSTRNVYPTGTIVTVVFPRGEQP